MKVVIVVKEIINIHLEDSKKHLPTGVDGKTIKFNSSLEPEVTDLIPGPQGPVGPVGPVGPEGPPGTTNQAEYVQVADTAGHFTTPKNVESILEQLFTYASDGKTLIAVAVTGKDGLPHTGDTFAQLAAAIDALEVGVDNFIVRDFPMETFSYEFNRKYSITDEYLDIYVSGRILINEADTLSWDTVSKYSIGDIEPDIVIV